MISIFKKKSLPSISKKSKGIFDVFTGTKEKCLALNQEISGHVEVKETKVKNLQEEVESLKVIQKAHTNLASKIDTFLND